MSITDFVIIVLIIGILIFVGNLWLPKAKRLEYGMGCF